MYSELSYLLGWDWYTVWDFDHFQKLTSHPLASKGRVSAVLISSASLILVAFYENKKFGYVPVSRSYIKCRTVCELDNVKHQLLNMGFKIDWYNYQLILQMFTEHYKVYAPYIPDKQEDDYNMKGLKQLSYL